jgi:hypothetical protein
MTWRPSIDEPAFPSRPALASSQQAMEGMGGAEPPGAARSAHLCASMARLASTGPSPHRSLRHTSLQSEGQAVAIPLRSVTSQNPPHSSRVRFASRGVLRRAFVQRPQLQIPSCTPVRDATLSIGAGASAADHRERRRAVLLAHWPGRACQIHHGLAHRDFVRRIDRPNGRLHWF